MNGALTDKHSEFCLQRYTGVYCSLLGCVWISCGVIMLTCRVRNMELASKPSNYWEECFHLRKPCPKFLQPVVDKVREWDVLYSRYS